MRDYIKGPRVIKALVVHLKHKDDKRVYKRDEDGVDPTQGGI